MYKTTLEMTFEIIFKFWARRFDSLKKRQIWL